jgi:hypothetical protein
LQLFSLTSDFKFGNASSAWPWGSADVAPPANEGSGLTKSMNDAIAFSFSRIKEARKALVGPERGKDLREL